LNGRSLGTRTCPCCCRHFRGRTSRRGCPCCRRSGGRRRCHGGNWDAWGRRRRLRHRRL
jgi:hypothetical protein